MKRAPAKMPPPKLPNAKLPDVASFECSCGTIHQSRDAQLPVGWTRRAGAVWCADCTRAGIASRQIANGRPSPADKVRLRGQVIDLLRQGAELMPMGSIRRAQWVEQVNELLTQQQRAA